MGDGKKWQITMAMEGEKREGGQAACLAAVAPTEGHELLSAYLLHGRRVQGRRATCAPHTPCPTHTHTH